MPGSAECPDVLFEQGSLDRAGERGQAAGVSTESGDLVDVVLDGLAQGAALSDLHRSVGDRFMSDPAMSPRALLDLAAEAFAACQVSWMPRSSWKDCIAGCFRSGQLEEHGSSEASLCAAGGDSDRGGRRAGGHLVVAP